MSKIKYCDFKFWHSIKNYAVYLHRSYSSVPITVTNLLITKCGFCNKFTNFAYFEVYKSTRTKRPIIIDHKCTSAQEPVYRLYIFDNSIFITTLDYDTKKFEGIEDG